MIIDSYGQHVFTEENLCELYMTKPDLKLKEVLLDKTVDFNPELNLTHIPNIIQYELSNLSVAEFDKKNRDEWFIPEEYKTFDIAKWLLDQCTHEEEMQRVGKELLLYQKRDMFILLQYMKYLVDTMRANNIVWGIGRGSSVSSFVLFLIGIHRINSLYYDLDIEEFLK
jgi:DNA polymerase III alpha subunit|tara:strand:- start:760 stop:1266 length:507 start_codon:yes stop_codon:yes gene_type:complete